MSGKKIAIDISIYLYRYSAENALIENLFSMMSIMQYYGIVPIFVFDGKPPEEKKALLLKRREEKWLAQKELQELLLQEKENNEERIKTLKRKCTTLDSTIIEKAHRLIDSMGCQRLQADGEADALCAALAIHGDVFACLSEDMDLFVYGCPRVLRYLSLLQHKVVVYHTDLILNELQISLENFRRLCILCGTDYNEKSGDFDFKTALGYYHDFNESLAIHSQKSEISQNIFHYLLDQHIITQEDVDAFKKIEGMFEIDNPLVHLKIIQEKEKEIFIFHLKALLREGGFIYKHFAIKT